jgi:putative flavoprotein involved in K+ transport
VDATLDTRLDTVVIGAGQAGLALAYHLRRDCRRFVVLEAADRVGDSWRRRWDSLTLFTPRRYDALPGMKFPGNPEGYPGKDEVADYLDSYAAQFNLPVRLGRRVRSVRRDGAGGFSVDTSQETFTARQVVVATGGFTGPAIPGFAAGLGADVVQLHSSAYRNPGSVPEGEVVVIGAGNTGVQIASELAAAGRSVSLSVSTLGRSTPHRFMGKSLFWWFERLGVMQAGADSPIGRRMKKDNSIVGTDLGALFRDVQRVAKAVDADSEGLLLADGTRRRPDAVVWATGYRPSYPWLHVPVLDETGTPIHYNGITDVPGLAFLGLPWQRNRGSALVGWVGRDAALLAQHLGAHLRTHRPAQSGGIPVPQLARVAA